MSASFNIHYAFGLNRNIRVQPNEVNGLCQYYKTALRAAVSMAKANKKIRSVKLSMYPLTDEKKLNTYDVKHDLDFAVKRIDMMEDHLNPRRGMTTIEAPLLPHANKEPVETTYEGVQYGDNYEKQSTKTLIYNLIIPQLQKEKKRSTTQLLPSINERIQKLQNMPKKELIEEVSNAKKNNTHNVSTNNLTPTNSPKGHNKSNSQQL